MTGRAAAAALVLGMVAAAPAQARAAAIDLNTVDPLSFRALAARVPPGLTPVIDGRLDDEVWGLAPATGPFVQREPDPGRPSTGCLGNNTGLTTTGFG